MKNVIKMMFVAVMAMMISFAYAQDKGGMNNNNSTGEKKVEKKETKTMKSNKKGTKMEKKETKKEVKKEEAAPKK